MIDRNGRLFGRINLIDAAAIAVVLFLIPVGYATYLLFRPARPAIDSVSRVDVTAEERRVAGGSMLSAKLKVRGSGFNPLLRARLGDHETLGFVFENPNSADVLVGLVPAGRYDLILYDGVQEVARARDAVDMQPRIPTSVRAYGWLTLLTPANELKAGFASDPNAPGAFRIISIGEPRPARSRVMVGDVVADLPVKDLVERAAELVVNCDWPSAFPCAIGGQALSQPPPITVVLPGSYVFQIEEIGPPAQPAKATVRVQLTNAPAAMRRGDRDDLTSARAAEITAIDGQTITLIAGVDESREGWRYRGQLLAPGSRFTIKTPDYMAAGTVMGMTLESRGTP
ncbi:MAG TPA: DUF4330 family protein [Vicinamibacterales bacterium]